MEMKWLMEELNYRSWAVHWSLMIRNSRINKVEFDQIKNNYTFG